ncbi:sporulation protein YunB [Clostridium aminobutyricum]|uniref:Sporulation protein YunB n=1 Tax=Clostridium aminobutyricum TaxID=33953 RepID=A0A939D792_CLOAM|nr:sporulation protein YunB [Clostridium aminobutyricum]MBN7772038.1 sporulation protein YunB [Clostridium aminobutyricum]
MFGWRSRQRFKACGHKKRGGTIVFCFIIILVLAISSVWRFYAVIHPSIDSIAQIKAKEMVTYAINEATCKQFFKESANINNLLIINTNNEGNIELVQSNTVAMNILAAELSKEIKQSYAKMEPSVIPVPLGTILGSQILSQSDLKVNLKVLPLSVSSLNFYSEFETKGINQTKYKVYIELTSKVRVLAPFSSKSMEIKNVVLVAEAVILGKVPNSYVVVPKENLLDATNGQEL